VSRQAKTYHVVEIDAGDKERVLHTGLLPATAREILKRLRGSFSKDGLRFVMYHDRINAKIEVN
jgi:hypothetical protein